MNRRFFIKTTSMATAMTSATPLFSIAGEAKRVFKVALIGCGGRGNSALGNIKEAAKILGCKVELAACADVFESRAKATAKANGCDEKYAFVGLNGYKEAIQRAEIVLLTTPLSFRPRHLAACIAAKKHVFAEKGVAVDGPGVRLFIETSRKAAKEGLTIVAGTQRRHQPGYLAQAKALKSGLVSPVIGGNVYWNGQVPWVRLREKGWSNKQYLCANWLNFTSLSGDHICEQHVHNIDVANWFIGRFPKSALGLGFRARRVSGDQYDFYGIDYDYGEGVHIHSMCRQIDGCHNNIAEIFRTRDSIIYGGGLVRKINGEKIKLPQDNFPTRNQLVLEHVDLLRSVMGTGPYLNEGERVALSTACAIIGRISAHTGQIVRLSDILTNTRSSFYSMTCRPTPEEFESEDDVKMIPELNHAPDLEGVIDLPGKPWRKAIRKI